MANNERFIYPQKLARFSCCRHCLSRNTKQWCRGWLWAARTEDFLTCWATWHTIKPSQHSHPRVLLRGWIIASHGERRTFHLPAKLARSHLTKTDNCKDIRQSSSNHDSVRFALPRRHFACAMFRFVCSIDGFSLVSKKPGRGCSSCAEARTSDRCCRRCLEQRCDEKLNGSNKIESGSALQLITFGKVKTIPLNP